MARTHGVDYYLRMVRLSPAALLTLAFAMLALVIGPTGFASSQEVDRAAAHCAEHDSPRDCPCCPDGTTVVPGCQSVCATFVVSGMLPLLRLPAPHTAAFEVVAALQSRTYAPPDPPPIA
jgi:hypothetical protein